MQQAQEQSFDMALFQLLSRHCSETGKWSVWLLASEVSRSGKTCKQALEFASVYYIGSFFFFFLFLFCLQSRSESTQQDLTHRDTGGSGRRDPGCYGKGHPDFTLMDSSDSVAEEELSWAPWQQATDR